MIATTTFRTLKTAGLMAFLGASLILGGCSSTNMNKAGYDEAEISDPFEDVNRAIFAGNDMADRAILAPVARGYRAVVPHPIRMGVRNFLRNLRTPVNVANQILQGDVEGAAGDTSRFMINTLIGVGGLIDVAKDTGIPYEQEDFGQTLATWGVGHGPYLVLPLFGPSSARDATGMLVDTVVDPVRLYLYNTDREGWYYARVAATTIDGREDLLDALDDLRRNSFDYYAALRSAYYQRREALLNDRNPQAAAGQAIPDYDAGEE